MQTIGLIVGLGNPGSEYEATRHNAGFWLVDRIARDAGAVFRAESRFQGELTRCSLSGHDCRLLKPTRYMNCSGQSVAAVAGFFRIPVDAVLVAHDDIDLPPGTVRLKQGGGDGGHNGLSDITRTLGDGGYHRLRLGVGRPLQSEDVADYVLQRPSKVDREAIDAAVDAAIDNLPLILGGDTQKAMNILHGR